MKHLHPPHPLNPVDLRHVLDQVATLAELADRMEQNAGDTVEMRALVAELRLTLAELRLELPSPRLDVATALFLEKWVIVPESQLWPAAYQTYSPN